MSRKLGDDEGKKFALNMRTTQELRAKLEAAAAASGRSMAHEAERRLEKSLDPVVERLIGLVQDNTKSGNLIRVLSAILASVNFEKDNHSYYLIHEGIQEIVRVALEEYFPKPKGLLADLVENEDEKLKVRVRERLRTVTEGAIAQRRIALYGEQEPTPGLTLLQTAMVLGLIPSDREEAARALTAAAEIAKPKRSAKAAKANAGL
jgi:hypothetical protein